MASLAFLLREIEKLDDAERFKLFVQVKQMVEKKKPELEMLPTKPLVKAFKEIASMTPPGLDVNNRKHDLYLYGQEE